MNNFVKKESYPDLGKINSLFPVVFVVVVFLNYWYFLKVVGKISINTDNIFCILDYRQPTRWDWKNDFRNSGKECFGYILI